MVLTFGHEIDLSVESVTTTQDLDKKRDLTAGDIALLN